ncbi:hypothetical protein [Falsiroseomonas sp. CW058]|uniref:hypothetical protein n=1 Tax=Falsiroseomonas sp. CW058 TaxID=3388664 RepID=UPI003D31B87E
MTQIGTPAFAFPINEDELIDFHMDVAQALARAVPALGQVFALTFGEDATQAALRPFVLRSGSAISAELFDRLGWRVFFDQHEASLDWVEATKVWRDGAAYAAQGTAPDEPYDQPFSREDRERRVKALLDQARTMLEHGAMLFGDTYPQIWQGVAARAAIDFGGTVTLEGLQLLSGISLGAVRNAVSLGELRLDDTGNVAAQEAKAWLLRRRDFCPSRWENPNDGQEPFDIDKVAEPDGNGMILVPQDVDGTPFMPDHVVRTAKSGPGLSITVGAKGSEEQHRDFYEALTALAKMDVPRWRRRNGAGNWGIVRARGAWVAVSKAEIDRQLAARSAEVA